VTRPEAATIALYQLGGAGETIHTEDVAVRLEGVAPGMFSWQKYRDRTDKELVRVALSDARLKAKYVIGSHSKGWMLTASGVAFAERAETLDAPAPEARRSADDIQLVRERNRLVGTEAYQKFVAGHDVSPDEVDAFFRLNVYLRGESREKKIARIENHFGGDPELGEVITAFAPIARERSQK
jgi:hypothetical protein